MFVIRTDDIYFLLKKRDEQSHLSFALNKKKIFKS